MKPQLSKALFVALAVCATLVALPLAAQEFCPDGGEILTCPAWADINGNRHYDLLTDALITFDFSADPWLEIDSPWEATCGDHPQVEFRSSDTMYEEARFGRWILTIEGFDDSRHPNRFALRDGSGLRGTATLVDNNEDGCYDSLDARYPDGETYFQFGFEFLCTNGDGLAEYISADWANASLFGMNGSCMMAGGDPQIWFPLVNSTLVPGPTNMHSSGCFRRADTAVPTLSQWGMLLTLLALAGVGWWLLRRRHAVA